MQNKLILLFILKIKKCHILKKKRRIRKKNIPKKKKKKKKPELPLCNYNVQRELDYLHTQINKYSLSEIVNLIKNSYSLFVKLQ